MFCGAIISISKLTSFSCRVRPLSDGNSPWSTLLIKNQKNMPLASLFVDQPGKCTSGNKLCLNYT